MTCYINEESVSTLKDGIETIVVPIHDQNDLEDLVTYAQLGTYEVVEWLLTELYRQTELDRVCGLSLTQHGNQVVANLELRQPGKQLEKFLATKSNATGRWLCMADGTMVISDSTFIEEGPVCTLSPRSLSPEKFTDSHHPHWKKDASEVVEDIFVQETGIIPPPGTTSVEVSDRGIKAIGSDGVTLAQG